MKVRNIAIAVALASAACVANADTNATTFKLDEATIADIHTAILGKQLTSEQLVRMYLARIKAYNGTCVSQPQGVLGPITTIANAGQINALSTLNLRPRVRKALGFDARKARSMTDSKDASPALPDALETAVELDRTFAATGKLVGPLHGIPISIKDQYDTADMRTTSGADAPYANDRPPDDSTFVAKLRAAGAIILGKANMGEYAGGDRSTFGGVFCNPYDTERSPGRSSGGSGASVAANFVVCSIGEESGPSVRNPAKNNNVVGLAPTQELVSRDGMIRASYMNDRVGPMCRTVADVARVLDVIAGFDPKDELTAFSVGRLPSQPYATFANVTSLAGGRSYAPASAALGSSHAPAPAALGLLSSGLLSGVRVGVMREFMDTRLFTQADVQSIQLVERGVEDLRKLGATIVDPGAGGALFQECVRKYAPATLSGLFAKQYPQLFPPRADAKSAIDHMPLFVELAQDAAKFPDGPTIRGLGEERTAGEGRYVLDLYLRERGDKAITSTADLIAKSTFYADVRESSGFSDKKRGLENKFADKTFDIGNRLQTRFALQQIVLQCMASLNLDAVTYPTGNVPAPKLGAPTEPTVNGRSALAWTLLGANGFPAISVPGGFTTEVYDRVADASAPGGTRLVGPIKASLPVGIDFLARPFAEPTLFKIAAAYEAATQHRRAPDGFGPVK